MNLELKTTWPSPKWQQQESPKGQINIQLDSKIYPAEIIINSLAAVEGPIAIYCWYEGSECLPEAGAKFMKQNIFEPLYKKKPEAKIYLYSLKAWDFKENIASIPSSTELGEAINRINTKAIECIYSSSFFQYCVNASKKNGLCEFIKNEIPKKKWLFDLSKNYKRKEKTIATFFSNQPSLFDCIKDKDVSAAYSTMQYLERYYLIQESVKRAFSKKEKKIEIAFVLPNDESKYYLDFPTDIKKMLHFDFGTNLFEIDSKISLQFFQYGKSYSRPYIGNRAFKVEAAEIISYFDYLQRGS